MPRGQGRAGGLWMHEPEDRQIRGQRPRPWSSVLKTRLVSAEAVPSASSPCTAARRDVPGTSANPPPTANQSLPLVAEAERALKNLSCGPEGWRETARTRNRSNAATRPGPLCNMPRIHPPYDIWWAEVIHVRC